MQVSPAFPQTTPLAVRLAFPALLAGNIALAFGPWLVRLADTGPVAAAFWRMALAVPFLLLVRVTRQPMPRLTTPLLGERRVAELLAAVPDEGDAVERHVAAAGRAVARLLRDQSTARASALDLLAADALATYAFELAADDPDARARAQQLLRDVAAEEPRAADQRHGGRVRPRQLSTACRHARGLGPRRVTLTSVRRAP